jgi:hypothetical protein
LHKKSGRPPLPPDKKRGTLSVTCSPSTAAFVRKVQKDEKLSLGQAAEYLILLGARCLVEHDGEAPSYDEMRKIEYDIEE